MSWINFEGQDLKIKSDTGRYRWEQVIIPFIIIPLLGGREAKGIRYTIRGLCYVLESIGVIPKTEKDFRKVYDAMSTARKNGTISMTAFIDNSRYPIKRFNDKYRSVIEQISDGLDKIDNLTFTDLGIKNIPRWHKQSYYVEIWVEKFSFAEVLYNILKDHEVVIIPNRGWSSISFLENNIINLGWKLSENQNLHAKVLYFGDLDPSGWVMDDHYVREIQRKFDNYLLYESGTTDRFEFKRVAITKEQLDAFNLRDKTNPNPEVVAKLWRNPNRVKFKDEFGSLFQIELEALEALQEFEDLVKREVDSLYDESVHNEVLNLSENNLTLEQRRSIVEDRAMKKFIHFKSGAPF